MTKSTIRAIFFDIDGTLVDSNDQHVQAWAQAMAAEGIHLSHQTIHDQIGKGADMLLPTLLPDEDEDTRKRIEVGHGEVFKTRFMASVQPFSGARELLIHAHEAGRQIVLASSASKAELEHYVRLLDIEQIVSASTSSDDVSNTKPAPDIFSIALKKIAPVEASQVIVVGDTPYDIEAAAKCGIAAIALRSGKFPDEALEEAGAMAVYDDVGDLLMQYKRSPLGN